MIDAGAEYRFYASDITRTFPANRLFSSAQKLIYEFVLAIQEAAFEELKPNNVLSKVYEKATETAIRCLSSIGLHDLRQRKTENVLDMKGSITVQFVIGLVLMFMIHLIIK